MVIAMVLCPRRSDMTLIGRLWPGGCGEPAAVSPGPGIAARSYACCGGENGDGVAELILGTDPDSVRLRRRTTALIFAAVAMGTIGFFAALTVAPLVAVELTGSSALSGIPNAGSLVGTALGATGVSRIMARSGRRAGLMVGFAAGTAGAVVAVAAVIAGTFVLFVAGMLLLGVGNSANLLARYAAADVHPAVRRTTVLGWVVWAGTVGAVVGPSLVDPAARLLDGSAVPVLAGGLLVAGIAFTVSAAGCGLLRPHPVAVSVDEDDGDIADVEAAPIGWSPVLVVALTTMVAGQFVMVFIMTMTPVHASHAGAELGGVGLIMSMHVFGMYAFTPVVGGLADRFGNLLVIGVGLALLVVASLAAALAPYGDVTALSAALFLLGLGWSFGFVSASGLLAKGMASAARARMQGAVDTAVFGTAAVASLSSGVVLSTAGYGVLCFVGAALIAIPAVIIGRLGPTVRRVLRPV
jgi:MFS family permease